jgi:hypothetical protein
MNDLRCFQEEEKKEVVVAGVVERCGQWTGRETARRERRGTAGRVGIAWGTTVEAPWITDGSPG